MRALILILIVAVVVALVALWSGFLNITPTRNAQVPAVAATENGVTASGGQTPTFDVKTGSVSVGAKETNLTVQVPQVQVTPAGNQAQQQQQQPTDGNTAR